MKKKVLALVCAVTLVMGMSISVCAAGSNTAPSAAAEASGSGSSSAPASPASEVVTPAPNATGQVFTGTTLDEFAKTTTVSGVEGASVTVVSNATAKALITEAYKVGGDNVFIATIVDLHGGAGTYTLGCPNVWAGQSVTIMHQKADGSYEYITPSKVENNSVTFTLDSTSPVAILINAAGATAPKTGDIIMMIIVVAAVCAGGAVMFGRKARA